MILAALVGRLEVDVRCRRGQEESLRRSLAHSIGEVASVFETRTRPLVQEGGEAPGGIGLLSRADR